MSALEPRDTGEGREEAFLDPINGVVQPPFLLPASRQRRTTNQLQHLLNAVVKALWKHRLSRPFRRPVDAAKLNLPDYHKIIPCPMDLRTIRKRLKNCYYCSAQDCIDDVNTMFNNVYTYHNRGEDIVSIARALEKVFQAKVCEMPKEERDVPVPPAQARKDKRKSRSCHGRHGQAAAAAVVGADANIPNSERMEDDV
ncbi:hypothetical protein HPB48_006804 [Haemaphysalis longicornis]|uniref:Bromo domain-containing protein n=1 Tax=Haemaphysalis longicornis TaxID=44386 RepID=A0A9J6FE28_HAELO|nr:hypothetical protein HPB48_006804 [Haemaphysalis longicornis]